MHFLHILLLFSTVYLSSQALNMEDYPMVVPAVEKTGHAWKIPIDNPKNSKTPFKGIAVAVHNNEILFAEYEEATKTRFGQAHFFSPSGGRTIGNDKFFLLQEDFMAFKRVPFKDLDKYVVNGKPQKVDGCTPVIFTIKSRAFMPILDKPGDRTKPDTPKYIGTYFVDFDMMGYSTTSSIFTQYNVKSFVKDPARGDRVEFLCRTAHVYS